MSTSFYTEEELRTLGLKSCGEHVLISRKTSIYGAGKISIGNNVRIDDFCMLSGNITLGSNIHISAFCALYGSHGIVLEDNTGISPRCTLLSASDDFGGDYLIGPVHPEEHTHVTGGCIRLEAYSHIGAGCTVMPGVTLEQGAVSGAMSLINKSLPAWTISAGVPARVIKERSKKLLNFQ